MSKPLPPAPGQGGKTWCDEGRHTLCTDPIGVRCKCECHRAKPATKQTWDPDAGEWR